MICFPPNMWGHREKTTVCKPGREVAGETHAAHTLISDFQNNEKIHFCCLSVLVCGLLWPDHTAPGEVPETQEKFCPDCTAPGGVPETQEKLCTGGGGEISDDQWMQCHQGSSQLRTQNLPPSQFAMESYPCGPNLIMKDSFQAR